MSQEQIEAANGNWRTSLPTGLTYPDHWDKEPQKDGPNPEHLAILRQGVEVWNRWWEENPNIRPNLTGADLSGADLRGYNLRLSILRKAKLGGADLNGADLTYANISMTDLSESLHLTQNQIDDAYGNRLTLLPPGLIHPEHWGKGRSSFADYFFKPLPESEDQPNPKSPLPNIQYPFPMDWNAEGKITVVPPQERPPAHGLSPATRDLLAQAQTVTAQKLAFSLDNSNTDRKFAEWLRDYADQSAKGGPGLSIIVLDNIVQNLRGLAVLDKEALASSIGNAVQFSNFTKNHDILTGFYPDFEDYQSAYSLTRDHIPAEMPDSDLVKLLSSKEASEIIDSSVTETIKAIQPSPDLLSPSDTENRKRWNFAKLGLFIRLNQLINDAPDFVKKLEAFITIARWLNNLSERTAYLISVVLRNIE